MTRLNGLFSEGLRLNPKESAFCQNPYAVYADLHLSAAAEKSNNTAFYWHDYDLWCLFGFDSINALLRDRRFGRQVLHKYTRKELDMASPPDHLSDFQEVEAWSLLTLEPPDHSRIRKLVTQAFISRNIALMQPRIQAFSEELLKTVLARLKSGESVDLLREYATPLPARIIAEMIGIPIEYIPQLLDWSHRMVRVYTMTQSREDEISANLAAAEFSQLIADLIKLRRIKPQEDLLTHLIVGGERGEKLTEPEIISTLVLVLNAGHEATVHQFGNAVKAIKQSQLSPMQLFKDRSQSQKTIDELMRFDTPLHLFTRYALEEVELTEHLSIAPGQQVGLLLGAANHDPQRFTEPTRFNPNRSDSGHVSLGAGIHYCLGAALAHLELHIGLKTLFASLPDFSIDGVAVYRNSYHFRGLDTLPITLYN